MINIPVFLLASVFKTMLQCVWIEPIILLYPYIIKILNHNDKPQKNNWRMKYQSYHGLPANFFLVFFCNMVNLNAVLIRRIRHLTRMVFYQIFQPGEIIILLR
jgi:hypothetical protein